MWKLIVILSVFRKPKEIILILLTLKFCKYNFGRKIEPMRNFLERPMVHLAQDCLEAWSKLVLTRSRRGHGMVKGGPVTSYDSDEKMTSSEDLAIQYFWTVFSVKFVKSCEVRSHI